MTHAPSSLTRRGALGFAIGGVSLAFPSLGLAAQTQKRLVVIVLRGALDGLHAAPAFGDPAYVSARNGLALRDSPNLRLNETFGLHPKLQTLRAMYQSRELLVAHAVATSYRERSHFDAQNVLETGAATPFGRPSGWLNAAMGALPADLASGRRELAVALAQQAPLILRGDAAVATWSPSLKPERIG